ncbi:MAG: TIGR03617 family F420-dependent LLM class oxidoreductase [Anaerolineae bacterium]|nr:TIGR03617 family F420-dependent LLM class oxidoreductase [Anaerolineae bacterium]
MRFDVYIHPNDLRSVPDLAQHLENEGFHAIWTPETNHNPYFPLVLAGHATQRLQLGTGIAVAFARSPTVTAMEAWDLARLTNGRFILGLGTQIKAHITRRFGMPWDSPVARLREYIEGMRALWDTFQNNARLNYRGEHYKLTFMTPFFQPEPLEHPHIPIFTGGVQAAMCQLAGELSQGFHVHPFHTADYLRNFILPNLEVGLARSGRTRAELQLICAIFVVTNLEEAREVKSQIAFYASTPGYRGVLEQHGWGDLQDRLSGLIRRSRWEELPEQISDEMLAHFAVVAPAQELAAAVEARYRGLLDRVAYYFPYVMGEREALWRASLAHFNG